MNLLLKYKHQCIIGGIVLLLVAAVSIPFMFASSNPILSQNDLDPCNPVEIDSGDESSNYLVVDIKGAVKKPGVYKMPEGSIVQDQTTPNMIQGISGIYERNPLISKGILPFLNFKWFRKGSFFMPGFKESKKLATIIQ